MNVLLIEDDPFKEDAIVAELKAALAVNRITCARAVQTAIEHVGEGPYDLIVLDIALPSHDRTLGVGNPKSMPSGGVEVLLELSSLERRDPVLIITQYPEVEIWGELVRLPQVKERLAQEVSANLMGIVHFEQSSDGWKKSFTSYLGELP